MKHTVIALAAAAVLAGAAPQAAQARCHGCGVAAGMIGGLAAGAIIGSAIANSGPAPVYVEEPPPPRVVYRRPAYVVEEPAYVVEPQCHIVKRRIYVDGVGPRWSREEVCD
jgi:hypothetical protein